MSWGDDPRKKNLSGFLQDALRATFPLAMAEEMMLYIRRSRRKINQAVYVFMTPETEWMPMSEFVEKVSIYDDILPAPCCFPGFLIRTAISVCRLKRQKKGGSSSCRTEMTRKHL